MTKQELIKAAFALDNRTQSAPQGPSVGHHANRSAGGPASLQKTAASPKAVKPVLQAGADAMGWLGKKIGVGAKKGAPVAAQALPAATPKAVSKAVIPIGQEGVEQAGKKSLPRRALGWGGRGAGTLAGFTGLMMAAPEVDNAVRNQFGILPTGVQRHNPPENMPWGKLDPSARRAIDMMTHWDSSDANATVKANTRNRYHNEFVNDPATFKSRLAGYLEGPEMWGAAVGSGPMQIRPEFFGEHELQQRGYVPGAGSTMPADMQQRLMRSSMEANPRDWANYTTMARMRYPDATPEQLNNYVNNMLDSAAKMRLESPIGYDLSKYQHLRTMPSHWLQSNMDPKDYAKMQELRAKGAKFGELPSPYNEAAQDAFYRWEAMNRLGLVDQPAGAQ